MPKQALKEKYKRYLTGIIVYHHFPVPVTCQLLNTNNLKFSVNNRPVTIPYQFVITAATLTQPHTDLSGKSCPHLAVLSGSSVLSQHSEEIDVDLLFVIRPVHMMLTFIHNIGAALHVIIYERINNSISLSQAPNHSHSQSNHYIDYQHD